MWSCLRLLVQTLTVAHSDFERSAFWTAALICARVGFLAAACAPAEPGAREHRQRQYCCQQRNPHPIHHIDLVTD